MDNIGVLLYIICAVILLLIPTVRTIQSIGIMYFLVVCLILAMVIGVIASTM